MLSEVHHKVTAAHLSRDAYLYVRQSTIRQVFENTESTTRQYALRDRAVALGWPVERVHVIDTDLGQSGATADREGFQRLVTEVGLGRAGMVLGLEVSRLAAIPRTGIGCSSSVPCQTRSFSTKTACTTRRTSMTDYSSA